MSNPGGPIIFTHVQFDNVQNDFALGDLATITFILANGKEVDPTKEKKFSGDVTAVVIGSKIRDPFGPSSDHTYHAVSDGKFSNTKVRWVRRQPDPHFVGVLQIVSYDEERNHPVKSYVLWDAPVAKASDSDAPPGNIVLPTVRFENSLINLAFNPRVNFGVRGPNGQFIDWNPGQPLSGNVETVLIWPYIPGPGIGPVEFPKTFRWFSGRTNYGNTTVTFKNYPDSTEDDIQFIVCEGEDEPDNPTFWTAPRVPKPGPGSIKA